MRFVFSLLLVPFLLVGCTSAPMTHGIPNFSEVEPGLYRGGQPTSEGWDWLRLQGVQWDLKLNTWEENPEPYTFNNKVPIWIDYCPITLKFQLLGGNDYTVDEAVQSLVDRPANVFVHCEHGQDRTGLIIACYRVRAEHWSKESAEKEMLAHGFHKSLLGLWNYWKEFQP